MFPVVLTKASSSCSHRTIDLLSSVCRSRFEQIVFSSTYLDHSEIFDPSAGAVRQPAFKRPRPSVDKSYEGDSDRAEVVERAGGRRVSVSLTRLAENDEDDESPVDADDDDDDEMSSSDGLNKTTAKVCLLGCPLRLLSEESGSGKLDSSEKMEWLNYASRTFRFLASS